MEEKKVDLSSYRTKDLAKNKSYIAPVRLWDKVQMNERIFMLFLLTISLSIGLGKLYTYYGSTLQLQNNVKYVAVPTATLSNISDVFYLSHIPNVSQFSVAIGQKFVNFSQYDNVASLMTLFLKTYGWLIRAVICSLITMSFTWFVIYNDSSIPGINPPSPLKPSKQRLSNTSGIQMNYLIGILNGILIFVYMCL